MNETIDIQKVLSALGIKDENHGAAVGTHWFATKGEKIDSYSPVDGKLIASVNAATTEDYEASILKGQEAFKSWRNVPAPRRGEIVRQFGEELRNQK